MHNRLLVELICICFNDTATTEIYTLSLHDALPILAPERASTSGMRKPPPISMSWPRDTITSGSLPTGADRKSTRLNSSHANISYAVFCLKKNTDDNRC